jgi:hypothetical protein
VRLTGFDFEWTDARLAETLVESTGRDNTGPESMVQSDKKISQ